MTPPKDDDEVIVDESYGKEVAVVPPGSQADGPSVLVPAIDFSTDPEVVRAVAEGERLNYGHLFNPAFATEISLIDPLPHQRIAVYDHLLPQPRLRFLLGDVPRTGTFGSRTLEIKLRYCGSSGIDRPAEV